MRTLLLGVATAGGAAVAALTLVPEGAFAPHMTAAAQAVAGLPSFPDIVDAVKPSVIEVRANISVPGGDGAPSDASADQPGLFDIPGDTPGPNDPHGRDRHQELVSEGSGFFISADGYAVTNRHVVEDSTTVDVKTDDGRFFTARVVGSDAVTDLALLKVDAGSDFVPARLADHAPRVGEWVLAIGNPFGLGGTVTAGIVSSDKRNIGAGAGQELGQDLIQIDAPVNHGNSGGPTFDVDGRVIGVNTMIISPNGGSIGIAFAIPAATLKKVIPQLRDHGFVTRGWIGVRLQPVTPEVADSLDLERARGAIVGDVQADGPAAAAGIMAGDVIQSVDGEPVGTAQDFSREIGDMRPGTFAKLGILRKGAQQEIGVTLGELPVQRDARVSEEPKATTSGLGLRLGPAARNRGADLRSPAADGVVTIARMWNDH